MTAEQSPAGQLAAVPDGWVAPSGWGTVHLLRSGVGPPPRTLCGRSTGDRELYPESTSGYPDRCGQCVRRTKGERRG